MEDRRAALCRMTQIFSGSPAQIEAHERELAFADALGLDPAAAEHFRAILFAAQQVEMQRDALNTTRAALWLRALKVSGLSDRARVPFPFDALLPWDDVGDADVGGLAGPSYTPPSAEFVAKARAAASLDALIASGSGSTLQGVEVGGLTLGGTEAA